MNSLNYFWVSEPLTVHRKPWFRSRPSKAKYSIYQRQMACLCAADPRQTGANDFPSLQKAIPDNPLVLHYIPPLATGTNFQLEGNRRVQFPSRTGAAGRMRRDAAGARSAVIVVCGNLHIDCKPPDGGAPRAEMTNDIGRRAGIRNSCPISAYFRPPAAIRAPDYVHRIPECVRDADAGPDSGRLEISICGVFLRVSN